MVQYLQQWIRNLTCDSAYLLGETPLFQLMLSLVTFGALIAQTFLHYRDMNHKLYLDDIVYLAQKRRNSPYTHRLIWQTFETITFEHWINTWCLRLHNITLIGTSINLAAHKPYKIMFTYMNRKRYRVPLRNRLKSMSFIERLSGPPIGYYCYDLFPVNSWELYQSFIMVVS